MNLLLRQVCTRRSIQLCDKISYKSFGGNLKITSTNSLSILIPQRRNYCQHKTETNILPPLMEFPTIVWPSFTKYIKNFIYVNFVIKPYFDPEFSLSEFVEASKHAVQVVSGALQQSDFTALEGLVDKDAIASLKTSISKLSMTQRQMLGVNKEDIFYSFPYQVGVIFNDSDKRWVEITMCYHVLRGLKELKESEDFPPVSLGVPPEFQNKIFVLNYRFIREFTKGVEDSWLINIINHYNPQAIKK